MILKKEKRYLPKVRVKGNSESKIIIIKKNSTCAKVFSWKSVFVQKFPLMHLWHLSKFCIITLSWFESRFFYFSNTSFQRGLKDDTMMG